MRIADIKSAVSRAEAAMKDLEQELNQADAELGDGDTGGMLARVVGAMAMIDLDGITDIGAAFAALAKAALSGTGSSLGTLLATALMTIARQTSGEAEVDWQRFAGLMSAARDAMMARGGAALGDKTVLDALDAVARRCEGLADPSAIATAAGAACSEALDAFRDKPCKIGRARMFADRSIGKDDPGMLAFARLTRRIAAG